ncbi:MAG TPA: ComEA family DNA-binding protein [Solirubrobacterales bacterium]|nr:ComEA family DNA-binding protein [Solirubrobacterales bacterium]
MVDVSRSQALVYGAVAVALLLLGARAIRAEPAASPPPPAGAKSFSIDTAGGGDLVVHVAGAVRDPGVYRLPAGSRVDDAVRRAGGVRGGEPDAVNLAARLTDGQQVVVPATGPMAVPAGAAAADGPISLGSATVEQLDTIEGIGPVTARDIVEFRDEHGGLASVEQLDELSGIGPATMESLRDRLGP